MSNNQIRKKLKLLDDMVDNAYGTNFKIMGNGQVDVRPLQAEDGNLRK